MVVTFSNLYGDREKIKLLLSILEIYEATEPDGDPDADEDD